MSETMFRMNGLRIMGPHFYIDGSGQERHTIRYDCVFNPTGKNEVSLSDLVQIGVSFEGPDANQYVQPACNILREAIKRKGFGFDELLQWPFPLKSWDNIECQLVAFEWSEPSEEAS